jgi:DNA (cytosine-5)-methyltransferase 1
MSQLSYLERGGAWFSMFLNDLARYGYDAQWHDIPASAIGAIHHRDRVWVIAYPSQELPDGAGKIYNSIANQVAKCRTPMEAMALLAEINQLQFTQDEPDHRKFDGISIESYAHGSLGNSVHTVIPEIIGHAILQAEGLK